MNRVVAAALLVGAAAGIGCGDDDDDGGAPPVDRAEYTSHCDPHGNRVYLAEDSYGYSSGIFVLEDDCNE